MQRVNDTAMNAVEFSCDDQSAIGLLFPSSQLVQNKYYKEFTTQTVDFIKLHVL